MDEQNIRNIKKSWRNKRGIWFRREDDSQSGEASGGSPQKRGADSFVLNDLVHQKMGPSLYKALATVAVAIFGGAFILGYRISSYSRDEIAKVVIDVVPDVRMDKDGPTIRGRFETYDSNIIIWNNELEKINQTFRTLGVFQQYQEMPSPLQKPNKGKKK